MQIIPYQDRHEGKTRKEKTDSKTENLALFIGSTYSAMGPHQNL